MAEMSKKHAQQIEVISNEKNALIDENTEFKTALSAAMLKNENLLGQIEKYQDKINLLNSRLEAEKTTN